ncbi:MAG: VOC family protein [Chloroflexi bacterium]|nr:MAG: VOC family protein [Chloroflexota bacterium]
MPDFSQSAPGLQPPTVVDHVLLPVEDLDQAARRIHERFALQAIPGGRHPKVGTANQIVPLGLQYLELIAVVDQHEAAGSRLGVRVAKALNQGTTFVAWALRTRDLDAVRATDPSPMPFVIEWRIPDSLHPGQVAASHGTGATALRRVIVGSREPDRLREKLGLLLGPSSMYEVRKADDDGVQEIVLENAGGELIVT